MNKVCCEEGEYSRCTQIMERSPQDECVQHDNVFSYISFKIVRRPMARPSNELGGGTGFCERGGTTCMHGLACDLGRAEGMQPVQEP